MPNFKKQTVASVYTKKTGTFDGMVPYGNILWGERSEERKEIKLSLLIPHIRENWYVVEPEQYEVGLPFQAERVVRTTSGSYFFLEEEPKWFCFSRYGELFLSDKRSAGYYRVIRPAIRQGSASHVSGKYTARFLAELTTPAK